MDLLTDWLSRQTPLEVAGVITGILCVWLAAKNIIWNWPVAIISVSIYIVIFLDAKLYADMGLQVYFLAMNIYGWIYWSRMKRAAAARPGEARPKPVSRIKMSEWMYSGIAVTVFTAVIGFLLHRNTDAAFPFVDSFCTAISLVAQVFLARRVMENWLMWIFVDVIYVVVYLLKDLHLTAAMYALYVYIAAMGYFDWKKDYRKQLVYEQNG
ncbi:MAG: nicotinamide mononucleotide transporter [Mucilaginibacter polytrichastri]|nr:nicotinamide mononucleotide transporter [Mucilaginibacter polytrichastri]